MSNAIETDQRRVCEQVGAEWLLCPSFSIVGVSASVKAGAKPLNGLRHLAVGDTCGWYIWGGEEWSDDPDFFEPVHVEHLMEWRPEVAKYLGLAPGWRFLTATDYEDIWFDPAILHE